MKKLKLKKEVVATMAKDAMAQVLGGAPHSLADCTPTYINCLTDADCPSLAPTIQCPPYFSLACVPPSRSETQTC